MYAWRNHDDWIQMSYYLLSSARVYLGGGGDGSGDAPSDSPHVNAKGVAFAIQMEPTASVVADKMEPMSASLHYHENIRFRDT